MIVAELTGDVQTDYYYDESGNVFGFKRGNSEYYYIRNGQGDIIGILDSSGTQIVSYVYDSWGKLVSISGSQADTIGEANPFRYRGYYYDTETGLYYLQSRYYDSEVGRFLNIDSVMGVNGDIHTYNLFAYCGNNPVNRADPTGCMFIADDLVFGIVVVCVVVLFVAAEAAIYSQSSAPVFGNNALKLPDTPQLNSNDENKILKFPVPPIAFPDVAPPVSVPKSQPDFSPDSEDAYTKIWRADYVKGVGVEILYPVSYEQALASLLSGSTNSFMCVDGATAKMLTNGFRGTRIYEIDKGKENVPGYYYHYHLDSKHGNPHIWHLGAKLVNWR